MKSVSKWLWIAMAFGVALALWVPVPAALAAPTERTFQIDASRFEYSPGTLRVNPGDRVTFELKATDVVHGLSIDGYDAEVTVEPGQTARLTFTAGRPGVFRFRCTVTCGNMHPFMIGKLYVGENTLLWRGAALALLAILAGLWKLWN